MKNNITNKTRSQLLVKIESAKPGDQIIVESYYNSCSSKIEIAIALDMAYNMGIKVISQNEPWLNSDNWKEIFSIYLKIHEEILHKNYGKHITHRSKDIRGLFYDLNSQDII